MGNWKEWGSQDHMVQTFYQWIQESVNIAFLCLCEHNLINPVYEELLKRLNIKIYSQAYFMLVVIPSVTSSFLPYIFFVVFLSLFSSWNLLEILLLNQTTLLHISYVSGSDSWTYKGKNIWNPYNHGKLILKNILNKF